jgi:hypothetical protein
MLKRGYSESRPLDHLFDPLHTTHSLRLRQV